MAQRQEEYVLARDVSGSIRLDAQHLLMIQHTGYVLHPDIPIKEDMKIAEIGTGTGIWLMNAAEHVPSSVQLHGYDISDSQFPAQKNWPKNLTFSKMDSLENPPASLVEQYDVVHLRFWCLIVKANDPRPLICHALKLLKPGGYIQWEDCHLKNLILEGETAEKFSRLTRHAQAVIHIDTEWLDYLPSYLQDAGLEVLHYNCGLFKPWLVTLCSSTFLLAHLEVFEFLEERLGKDVFPEGSASFLDSVFAEVKRNGSCHWRPVTLLARSPVE